MSLPRVRLESCSRLDAGGEGLWRLDDFQARHLMKSLRCYEGAMVEGLLGEGTGERIMARVERSGELFLLRAVDVEAEGRDPLETTLLIGLLKHDQFESVLRASAELGVKSVFPILCERSVPRPDAREIERKMSRWRRILDEGTKVSGSVFAPNLEYPVNFRDVDWGGLPNARYAALLSPIACPIASVGARAGELVFAVGPEGDWTDFESSALLGSGFVPVSLGRRILRASTAAMAGCAWFRLSAELELQRCHSI